MASEIVFGKNSDKMHHDIEIFEIDISEYIKWFKSDPTKRVLPERCMRLGKSTFRKRIVYYELDGGTGVLFRKIKQDG